MKKFILSLFVTMLSIGAFATDKIVYSDASLPANAKEALANNFKAKVNFVKIESNVLGRVEEYEVVLRNGTEVEFDCLGNLKSVDAGANGVPASLILTPIKEYIKKNYGKQKIVELDIYKKYYKLKLADGRELKFDRTGRFLSEDR